MAMIHPKRRKHRPRIIDPELLALRQERNRTLFLTHLSDNDRRRFHAACLTYSGETGISEHLGAYIATYLSELLPALHAMAWRHISLHEQHGDVFVRRDYRRWWF